MKVYLSILIERHENEFFLCLFLVMVRVTGGEAPGGSALAPKIGPLGLVSFPYNLHFIVDTNRYFVYLL